MQSAFLYQWSEPDKIMVGLTSSIRHFYSSQKKFHLLTLYAFTLKVDLMGIFKHFATPFYYNSLEMEARIPQFIADQSESIGRPPTLMRKTGF